MICTLKFIVFNQVYFLKNLDNKSDDKIILEGIFQNSAEANVQLI